VFQTLKVTDVRTPFALIDKIQPSIFRKSPSSKTLKNLHCGKLIKTEMPTLIQTWFLFHIGNFKMETLWDSPM